MMIRWFFMLLGSNNVEFAQVPTASALFTHTLSLAMMLEIDLFKGLPEIVIIADSLRQPWFLQTWCMLLDLLSGSTWRKWQCRLIKVDKVLRKWISELVDFSELQRHMPTKIDAGSAAIHYSNKIKTIL